MRDKKLEMGEEGKENRKLSVRRYSVSVRHEEFCLFLFLFSFCVCGHIDMYIYMHVLARSQPWVLYCFGVICLVFLRQS